MKSDQEIISAVETILAANPLATRNTIKKATNVSVERLVKMSQAGLIKLPNKIPKNMCHLFSNQTKWKQFRLRGSPIQNAKEQQ